jgi:outer membrane protein OmpA-like peptidoglycan-associated protein
MLPTNSMLLAVTIAGFAVSAPIAVSHAAGQPGPAGLVVAQQDQKPGEKKDEHHPSGTEPPAAQKPTPGQPKNVQEQHQEQHPAQQPQHQMGQEPHGAAPAAQEQHQEQHPGPGQQPPHQMGQEPHGTNPAAQEQHQEQHPGPGQQPPQHQMGQEPHGSTPAAQEETKHPIQGQNGPQQNQMHPPAAAQAPSNQPAIQASHAGAVPPPTAQVRPAQDFIRAKGAPPSAGIASVRQERKEVHEGNKDIIQEGDRTIVRDGNQTIIRHNEVDRFAVGARSVHNEQRGNQTVSVVVEANGSQVESIVDADGRLIKRTRRDPNGREIVIIDNSWVTPQLAVNFVVNLPPPVINIPREHYILDMDHAVEADVFAVLTAPPIERIDRRYSLDEIRYSPMLRDRMPRIDLDTVTFETGSWQIGPEEFDKLAFVAEALNRAIDRNPGEVFLIEGYTDAVGNDVDNLSLSDRRAETVAVALTEQFHVPPENLATQGYGSQFLKIATDAPERQNRRVAVRRITPLLGGDERAGN